MTVVSVAFYAHQDVPRAHQVLPVLPEAQNSSHLFPEVACGTYYRRPAGRPFQCVAVDLVQHKRITSQGYD